MDLETSNPVAFFLNLIALVALIFFISFFIHVSLKVIPLWTPMDSAENLIIQDYQNDGVGDLAATINADAVDAPKQIESDQKGKCGPPSPMPKFKEQKKLTDPNILNASAAGAYTNFRDLDILRKPQPNCVPSMRSNNKWIA